jgi:hypothetical protein
MGIRTGLLTASALLSVAAALPVQAKPAYRKGLTDYFGALLPSRLADCRTCHVDPSRGEPVFNTSLAKPHNAFGARLMAVGQELDRAGKTTDIASRLDAVLQEDSDQDGVSNVAEILTGHLPGAKSDKPTAAELAKVPRLLAQLRRQRAAYAWRPFDPVRRPELPKLENAASAAWVRNPIDVFVAAERDAHGLKPRPEAPRGILLRRVYLDLIGVPPTREQLQAFLDDRKPNAYERVVDRLLASPQYGERWGRHWMDVWRYSDWDGYGEEIRNSQRHIWRWRDWIVDSLNEDKGYDRMVQEMLAGDELAPGDPKVLPATGFLARNWYKFSRHEMLTKVVESTSKAFLGLTINCARCHDHKYDPISQKEYYNFRAFFEPFDVRTDRVPGQADLLKDGLPHVYDADLKAETFVLMKGDDRKPDRTQPAVPGVPSCLGRGGLSIQAVNLPPAAICPDRREFVEQETLSASASDLEKAGKALNAAREKKARAEQTVSMGGTAALAAAEKDTERAELAQRLASARHAALVATIRAEHAQDTHATDAGGLAREAQAAQRQQAVAEAESQVQSSRDAVQTAEQELAAARSKGAAPATITKAEQKLTAARTALEKSERALADTRKQAALPVTNSFTRRSLATYPPASSGRRLALARWITDAQNPLAARVAVNHIWMRHFGKPLVPTVFDFGANGQPPTHPKLLDWLASEFVGASTSVMKYGSGGVAGYGSDIHSHTPKLPNPPTSPREAQQSSATAWSMKRIHRLIVTSATYRMDSGEDAADVVRDPDNRYLWRMNSRRMEAEAVRDSLLAMGNELDPTLGGPDLDPNIALTSHRRSLYFRHSLEKQVTFLQIFDQASVSECYQRDETVVPQQALALANSPLSVAEAQKLAGQLWSRCRSGATPEQSFVEEAFLTILCRRPAKDELTECRAFLGSQARLLRDAPKAGTTPVDPDQRAREDLIHVLLNHNDFVTVR